MLVGLSLLVAEAAIALFHTLPLFPSFSSSLSPPSYLSPIVHPTLVHFLIPLCCLDEWFSKGKILPLVFS